MLARVLAVALVASLAVPVKAAPMQPTGKWVVNFDEAQCLAQRDYGTPADPFKLILKQPALGSVMQVAVQTKGYFRGQPEQVDGGLRFDSQNALKIPALQWRPAGSQLTFRMINVPLNQFAGVRAAQTLRFHAGMLRKDLALSDVPALLQVMDKCVQDLRRVWNAPTVVTLPPPGQFVQAPTSSRAAGDLSALFRAEDYPTIALRNEQSGGVVVVVLVDERGVVADCSVVESSGAAVLDSQACAVIRERASFKPRMGPNGKPGKDAFIQRINWMMR